MDNKRTDRLEQKSDSQQSLQFNSFLQEIGFNKSKKSEYRDEDEDKNDYAFRSMILSIQQKKQDINATYDRVMNLPLAYKDNKNSSSIPSSQPKNIIVSIKAKTEKINSCFQSLKAQLSKFGSTRLLNNKCALSKNVKDSNCQDNLQKQLRKLGYVTVSNTYRGNRFTPVFIGPIHNCLVDEPVKKKQMYRRVQKIPTKIIRMNKKKIIPPVLTEEKIYRNLQDFQINKMMDEKDQKKGFSQDFAKRKRVQQKRNSIAFQLAIFQAYKQDNQHIIQQSISFLDQILSNEKIPKSSQYSYSRQTIRSYFQEYFRIGFTTFLKYSSIGLQNVINRIIEEFQQHPIEEVDIRLQILSHFFRNVSGFNEYQLKKHFKYDGPELKVHLKMLNYSSGHLQRLKRCYIKHQNQIKYFDQGYNLQKIANTYAYLLRKSKLEQMHGQSIYLAPNQGLLYYIKTQRKQFIKKNPQILEQTQRNYLSLFARNIKKHQPKMIEWSQEDILGIINIFNSLIDNDEQVNLDQIKQISKRYGRTLEQNSELFKKYQANITQYYHQSPQKIDYHKHKQMRCLLFQEPDMFNEQIQRKMFWKYGIFIGIKQIESSIDNQMQILIKQLLFDYMEKSLHQITSLSMRCPLAFVDVFSTVIPIHLQQSDADKTTRTTQVRHVSFYVAVSSRGEAVCNVYLQKTNLETVFGRLVRQLKNIYIFAYRDKGFLFENWFQRPDIMKLHRKKNKIIPIPSFAEIGNPCKKIIERIQEQVKSIAHSQSSLRILAQKIVKQIDGQSIKIAFAQNFSKSNALFKYLRAQHKKDFGVSRQQQFQDMKLLISKEFIHQKQPQNIMLKSQKKKIEELTSSVSPRAGCNEDLCIIQKINYQQELYLSNKITEIISKISHDQKTKAITILKMINQRQMFLNQLVNQSFVLRSSK